MSDTQDEDWSPTPPSAERVAARGLVLAAVACRALIEKDAGKSGAEELRLDVLGWLDSVGAAGELEAGEHSLLSTPLGSLDKKATINATWQSEGMVVLSWALGSGPLPPFHEECKPFDVANAMGLLDARQNTPLHRPCLRDSLEIEYWADAYLTLHWRLRQFSLEPGPMDFVAYVSACNWGPLSLDEIEIKDNDLAVAGVRIDRLEYAVFRRTLSIVQERHQAFNWLLGFEPVYSEVTTDT